MITLREPVRRLNEYVTIVTEKATLESTVCFQ